jgi:hypothetical protein
MPKKPKNPSATENTPEGFTVPVPSRDALFANLKEVAKVGKRSTPSGPKNWLATTRAKRQIKQVRQRCRREHVPDPSCTSCRPGTLRLGRCR